MKKKALSILLAIAMMLTMMPAMALTAFAAEDESQADADQVVAEAVEEEAAVEESVEAKAPAKGVVFDFVSYWWWNNWAGSWNYGWNLDKNKEHAKSVLENYAIGFAQDVVSEYKDKIDGVSVAGQGYYAAVEEVWGLVDEAFPAILAKAKEEAIKMVNADAFANPSFDAPSEELEGVLAGIAADIENAETVAELNSTVFKYGAFDAKDFLATKAAIRNELIAKAEEEAVKDAEGNVSEDVQLILDKYNGTSDNPYDEGFWGEINKALTYEELARIRDNAQRELELQIGAEKEEVVGLLNGTPSGTRAVKLSWTEVEGATYNVYAARCGNKYKLVKTTTSAKYTVKKIGKKKLAKHKTYKFYVVAKDAEGNVLYKTDAIHVITAKTSGKYANAKSITVASNDVEVAKTTTAAGQKVVTKIYKSKKHLKKSHGAATRYTSNNEYVASVDTKGNITANHLGTAIIYVQDIGGLYQAVTVTVTEL